MPIYLIIFTSFSSYFRLKKVLVQYSPSNKATQFAKKILPHQQMISEVAFDEGASKRIFSDSGKDFWPH